jgi:hypothetical protein
LEVCLEIQLFLWEKFLKYPLPLNTIMDYSYVSFEGGVVRRVARRSAGTIEEMLSTLGASRPDVVSFMPSTDEEAAQFYLLEQIHLRIQEFEFGGKKCLVAHKPTVEWEPHTHLGSDAIYFARSDSDRFLLQYIERRDGIAGVSTCHDHIAEGQPLGGNERFWNLEGRFMQLAGDDLMIMEQERQTRLKIVQNESGVILVNPATRQEYSPGSPLEWERKTSGLEIPPNVVHRTVAGRSPALTLLQMDKMDMHHHVPCPYNLPEIVARYQL